jgi:hypothetical protein
MTRSFKESSTMRGFGEISIMRSFITCLLYKDLVG